MSNKITISGRSIGTSFPPYVIAEMSANHNGSIENAFEIINAAKKAGVDAVKMQTYTPDTITIDSDSEDFKVRGGLWDGRTLYDLYKEAHTPWSWHKPLFEYAKKINLTIFSSPFDESAVDLLEDLNAPAYKIASFEAIDLSLIKYAAKTRKPLIISTGMASEQEIKEAIDAAYEGGCSELGLLLCVSGYPALAADYNLRTLEDMSKRYGVVVGLSDHTLGNVTSFTSIALGAAIIEKHFTLDRNGGGPDDSFSLEPVEMESLCCGVKTAWDALGRVDYDHKSSEKANLKFRRSLYFVRDIHAGEAITKDHVRSIRPGFGLPPKLLDQVLGKKVPSNIKRGTPLSIEILSGLRNDDEI